MRRMLETARAVTYFRDLRALLVSIFFSMAGIYIIVSFSFIYGSQVIQWDESTRVLMFITVQITAAIGAILFGWLQGRIGAKTTYLMTLVLWVVAILAIWQTPAVTPVLNAAFGAALEPQDVFLFAGVLSGLSLGSAQSAGRALVGVLTPSGKAAEFSDSGDCFQAGGYFRDSWSGLYPVGVGTGRCHPVLPGALCAGHGHRSATE